MTRLNSHSALLALTLALLAGQCPAALSNDVTIKDGFGEEVTWRSGWFGHKSTGVKDRLGDSVLQSKGSFGGKETQVNILGNTFKRKKGLFGGTDVQASTIFGDKVTTKKGLFGRRKTTVDVSGISSCVHDLFARKGGQGVQPAPGGVYSSKSGLLPAFQPPASASGASAAGGNQEGNGSPDYSPGTVMPGGSSGTTP